MLKQKDNKKVALDRSASKGFVGLLLYRVIQCCVAQNPA